MTDGDRSSDSYDQLRPSAQEPAAAAGRSPNSRRQKSRLDYIQVFATIATLAIAGGGLYYTGTGFRDAHQQLQLNEQGQLTEWYSAAVTDLGSSSAGVRVGGIYLLRQVMNEDPAEQPVVINILTAFIRANAPRPANPDEEQASLRGLPNSRPSADIQAALTVLAKRDPHKDGGAVIDLNLTNLEGANLPAARFTGACLVGALLSGADLAAADLAGADLFKADMVGANLEGTNFENANLDSALLGAANTFDDAGNPKETKTNFEGAGLSQANLTGADFRSARFNRAILDLAIFRNTQLNNANFTSSYLWHTHFVRATGENLTHANQLVFRGYATAGSAASTAWVCGGTGCLGIPSEMSANRPVSLRVHDLGSLVPYMVTSDPRS